MTLRSCYIKPVKMFVFGDHDAEKHNKKTSEGNEQLEALSDEDEETKRLKAMKSERPSRRPV